MPVYHDPNILNDSTTSDSDFKSATSIASNASDTHSFTPGTFISSLWIDAIYASALKAFTCSVSWGPTGAETTKATLYGSATAQTVSLTFPSPILLTPTDTINIIMTNNDGSSQTLNSNIVYHSNAVPTFIPTQLPFLACWLDASNFSSVTTSSSNVVSIADQSGFTDDAVASGSVIAYNANVQNGLHAMHFNNDGTSQLLFNLAQLNGLPSYSIGILVKVPSASGTNYIFNRYTSSSSPQDSLYMTGANLLIADLKAIASEAQNANKTALTASHWYRLIYVWDSTISTGQNRLKIYVNNVDDTDYGGIYQIVGSGSTTTQPSESIGVPMGSYANGYVGEFVMTTGALSTANIADLDAYWVAKWGL